ncbi:ankyrin repeat domain-containing protein [Leptospira sarikeiensis]|uniref:Ankyrin repeat domain-containing protein n=2 Tax=Leptospira sarikeiensis TaxID=2484943 RepID=A0A4R9K0U0_9LEPT|nr:ankyrin repeat domain-containing protein [Leptospira sarikeiensis]
MLLQVSCITTTQLWCAGCKLTDAYKDPLAQKLVKATVQGDSAKVSEFVKEGANPNHLEPGKVPILMWAICANNVEGFEALLKAGADPNLSGTGHGKGNQGGDGGSIVYEGWSPLVFAAGTPDPRFLRLAIQYGGDVNSRKGSQHLPVPDNPLIWASYNGLFDNIKILIGAGADINTHTQSRNGPEEAIGVMGRFDIAIWFLENGYAHDLQGLAMTAENRGVHKGLQSYKEKLIDMLVAKGIRFPVSNTYKELHKYRELPPGAIMDIVYGRKDCRDFPLKPGRWNDKSCKGAPIPD